MMNYSKLHRSISQRMTSHACRESGFPCICTAEKSEITGRRSVPPKIACPKNIPAFVVWDVNVMIRKRQYYTGCMKISQVYYFLCHVLNNKTRKDVCFSPQYNCREFSGLENNANGKLLLLSR